MRDAIERAAANNALRQQRLEKIRQSFGSTPTAGSVLFDIMSIPEQNQIEQERLALQPQIQEADRQYRSQMGRDIEAVTGQKLNPDNFDTPTMQAMLGKFVEAKATPVSPYQQQSLSIQQQGNDLQNKKLQQDQRQFDQTMKFNADKFLYEKAKLLNEIKTGGLDSKEVFDRANKLRDEYVKQSGNFVNQRDAFLRVQASAKDPSAAGDLSLIFNYMKVLDPGSTVREGEFATAQNSGGVPDRIMNQYNKVLKGERLAPSIRTDFVNRAGMLFNAAQSQHGQLANEYKGLAERFNVAPENVLVNMDIKQQTPPADLSKTSTEDLLRMLNE